MLSAKNAFKDIAEELSAYKEMTQKLKMKYDCALNEIKDLQSEQNGEKEDLLIQLRQQDLDIKFYTKVVDMVMKPEELSKLKMKSSYDDATNEWQIPIFLLKNREVALPSLSIKKNA